MKKKNIYIYLILFCMLIYSGEKIYKWYKENNESNNIIEQINNAVIVQNDKSDEGKEKYNIDFKSLKEQNDNTIAWIKVNNTNIEYPIVRAKDNEFYLTHSFNKKINSAGWIFADYKNKFDNTDKNIVIYGHNRRDNSMFGSLKKVLKSEWYNNKENEKIILNTEKQNNVYQIFSIYKIEEEDYYIKTEFKNDSEFEKFIQTIKERSIKDFKIDVSKKDSILTLSTCANNNKYRVVVHAKKIIEGEQ